MKVLKIETGKYYRTSGGSKVRIYATDGGGDYPVHGAVLLDTVWNSVSWTVSGRYSVDEEEPQLDIISEWQQTIDDIGFDKSCLPKWAKFIVMDEKGRWYYSIAKPTLTVDGVFGRYWSVYEKFIGIIPPEHTPKNFNGDWKDSLFEIK